MRSLKVLPISKAGAKTDMILLRDALVKQYLPHFVSLWAAPAAYQPALTLQVVPAWRFLVEETDLPLCPITDEDAGNGTIGW